MIFRSIGQADLPRVAGLIAPEPASTLTPGQFMDRFTRREYRPEWTWVAEETQAGPPLAVAVWWGAPGEALPQRLTLRAEPDDEVFVGLFHRVLAGTLDTTSRREAEAIGAEAQARQDVAFYRDRMLGDRSWWRVAAGPDDQVVGFGLPSRNTDFPVVGYLGVLPEHRGHHYVDEILAGITRYLAIDARARTIRADTDLVNRPMAAAFERAGYRNFACRLVLSA